MAKCAECGQWQAPGHDCQRYDLQDRIGALIRERDEARDLAAMLLRWLDEALLVNNFPPFYDRYPWLKGRLVP